MKAVSVIFQNNFAQFEPKNCTIGVKTAGEGDFPAQAVVDLRKFAADLTQFFADLRKFPADSNKSVVHLRKFPADLRKFSVSCARKSFP